MDQMTTKEQKMSGVNSLLKERYTCLRCEKAFTREEVRRTWKCPVCTDEYIHVYAEDEESGTRIVLTRKAASEVSIGDLVHLPGMLAKEAYRVLGINTRKDKIGLGLEGYGEVRFDPDGPVNCREGSW